MEFTIAPKVPFDFKLIASLYSRFPTQCVDIYEVGVYKRALRIGGKIHFIKVRSSGSVGEPKLFVETKPSVQKSLVEEKIKWMFGTEENLGGFYKLALKDEKFAPVIKDLYGLRAPKTPNAFEALIIAITEQQIALPVALGLRKRLVKRFGEPIEVRGCKYYAFPTPDSLVRAEPREIRKLGLSTRKSEYIVDVAKKVAKKEIDLEEMRGWKQERILETLTKIRGIGPWTVEYMMCRGMGRYEALPANDLALRTSLTKFLDKKERISEKEARKFLERFGKYKGYAAFYLIYAYAFQKYPQEKLL